MREMSLCALHQRLGKSSLRFFSKNPGLGKTEFFLRKIRLRPRVRVPDSVQPTLSGLMSEASLPAFRVAALAPRRSRPGWAAQQNRLSDFANQRHPGPA